MTKPVASVLVAVVIFFVGVGVGSAALKAGSPPHRDGGHGRWYERGMLHPHLDYDEVPEYLHARADAMDNEGFVHMPQLAGLGDDIDFGYIDANLA